MSSNRWKYFRWTPRTAWITIVYVVVVPAAFGYVGFVTDVSLARYSFRNRDGVRLAVEGDG